MERLSRGKYIPLNSEEYKEGLNVFKANLQELVSLCLENNIPLILSSQASNVRTQFPFISGDFPGLSSIEKKHFELKLHDGISLHLQTNGKTGSR